MFTVMQRIDRWPIFVKCALTVVAVGAAMAAQAPFASQGAVGPLFVFLSAVFVSTILFGRVCGWLSVALSALLSALFFDPFGSFLVYHASDLLEIQLYILISAGAVLSVSSIRRTALVQAVQNNVLVAEKEVMSLQAREAIHRAANHFSMLDALVRRSARGATDPNIRLGVEQASQLIHKVAKLNSLISSVYDEENADSKMLLTQACSDLRACAPRNVIVCCEMESLCLPLSQLRLILLIIHELVTNSLKYAFPGNSQGTIRVAFYKDGDLICLLVADDGVGMDGMVKGSGLGLALLKDLTNALNAKLEMRSNADGTSVEILIPCCANKKADEFEHRAVVLH
jgi:two-component sensor histidine kinase